MDEAQRIRDQRRKEAKARQVVSARLHRFYNELVSGFEADADEFFRRVMQQQPPPERDGTASQP